MTFDAQAALALPVGPELTGPGRSDPESPSQSPHYPSLSADLTQKLGNYLSATALARLKGLLTNPKGDRNRPVVLLWMVDDLIKKATEKVYTD